jgi:hypothetical protein
MVMKKKLSLVRETLVALQPTSLGDVHGGNQQSAIVSVPSTMGPGTRALCPPSQLSCPSRFMSACPQPSIPSLGGQGGDK